MKFKLIVVLVQDEQTETVLKTAREQGATGCTVITNARGEGLHPRKTFLGLTLEGQRDMILLLVEEHLSRDILEALEKAAELDERPGSGIAFQIDIEDAVGLSSQFQSIAHEIEDQL